MAANPSQAASWEQNPRGEPQAHLPFKGAVRVQAARELGVDPIELRRKNFEAKPAARQVPGATGS